MDHTASPRILIVGAGTTGLTAALELARRGLVPTVIDASAAPSPISRAVGLTPRSLAHLAPSGIAERLIKEGIPLGAMRIHRGARLAMAFPLHSETAFFRTLVALPQDQTVTMMIKRLREMGGEVAFGTRLERLDGTGPIIAHFEDGTDERFDVVIGADGVGSTVRKAARITFPGHDLDGDWSLADVDLKDWQSPGDFTLDLSPGRIGVVVPLAGDRYRLVANTPTTRAAFDLPMKVASVHLEETFRISVRQAQAYAKGSIVLAGDAAHTFSPIGGRGMNLGIGDAAVLADCLARGRIADYPSLRRPVGRWAIRETEIARKLMTAESPLWGRAFSAMMSVGDLAGPLRRRIGRYAVEF